jgi:NADH-quinone oxidoreductase subunit L
MTFHGKPRADDHTMAHVHESPITMWGPLAALSVGAIFAGWWFHGQFIGENNAAYWQGAIFNAPDNHVIASLERTPFMIALSPTLTGIVGLLLSVWFYLVNPAIPAMLAARFRPVYLFLLNKWYFDELYDVIFVRPALWLAREFWQVGDVTIIDGVPNGLAALAQDGSRQAVRLQTGSIAVYAFTMLIGLVGLISIFLIIR